MADNVTFQSGTLATAPDGSVIGTDNIGGIIYQRVKVVWGVDGVVNDTSATNPLPVTLAAGVAVIGHVITDAGSTTVVTGSVAVTGTFFQATQPVSAVSLPLPTGAMPAAGGTVGVTGTVTTSENGSGTGTVTSVAGANTNTTLLAANAARLGSTVANESTAILYLKLGAASSTTSYTVQLPGSTSGGIAYYEVPFKYTGIITGTWASATGNARITELTA